MARRKRSKEWLPSEDLAAWDSGIEYLRLYVAEEFKRYLRYSLYNDGHRIQPFQELFADILQGTYPGSDVYKKVILGFRGSAKTYVLRRYVEWRWRRMPWTQVVVHSSTDALAGQFTTSIKSTIDNDLIFDDISTGSGTGTLSFTLKGYEPEKGHTIRCAGINTSITGQRAHLYLFDDPEPDVMPEAMNERILAAFQEAELVLHPVDELWDGPEDVPTPERTQYVVTGQPHWTGTAYLPRTRAIGSDEVPPHPLKDALFFKIPALRKVPIGTEGSVPHDSGNYAEISMMPDRFPTEQLINKRDKRVISTPRWRLQMDIDCSPIEGEMSVVPVTRLIQRHTDLFASGNLTVCVDPADSEEYCEWGVVTAGISDGQIHVFDMLGFRASSYNTEEGVFAGEGVWAEIFQYCNEMSIGTIYIEKNLKAARVAAMRMLRKCKVKAQVFEYAAKVNKLQRIIDALEHPTNTNMVSFEPHVLQDPENFRQLAELRYTKLPKPCDRIDALAGVVSVLIDLPSARNIAHRAVRLNNSVHADRRPATYQFIRHQDSRPFDRLKGYLTVQPGRGR
jgi:hypothetical protein